MALTATAIGAAKILRKAGGGRKRYLRTCFRHELAAWSVRSSLLELFLSVVTAIARFLRQR